MTGHPLRVLVVEDNPADAELMAAHLRRFGYRVDWACVDCEEDFLAALHPGLDVIISDYSLPHFDARRALELHQERGVPVPFIVVSGTVGEEQAVAAMRAGATDYLLKDRLARLGMAVARALELRRAGAERRRLQNAMEQAGEAVMITDAEGTILYVNPAFEAITGYRREEALGQTPRLLMTSEDGPEKLFGELWHRIRREGTWGGRVTHRRRDGTTAQIDLNISPLRDERGEIVEYVGVCRDVTEQVELEQAFLQAQKMEAVGRLAGGVAHDFNNLLTAILGYGELALDRAGDDRLRSYVEEILLAARRGSGLTRQLLTFSRQQDAWPEVLDLDEVVRSFENLLTRIIGEDVRLDREVGSDVPPVFADRGQLEQVIVNLVVNARDALPDGGTIRIVSGGVEIAAADEPRPGDLPPGRYATLRVEDDGIGMDRDTKQRIFEPFFSTKEPGKGTGLGLSTAFGIVQKAGGVIRVESETGEGTAITLLLPAAKPGDEGEPARDAASTSAPPVAPSTLLVVEDEAATGKLIQRVLRQDGHRVLLAGDAEEALEVCRREAGGIDLLLTDVILTGMAGPALAAEVRRRRPGTPVLYMSGYSGDVLDRQELGDVAYLAKPFNVAELREAVAEALRRRPAAAR